MYLCVQQRASRAFTVPCRIQSGVRELERAFMLHTLYTAYAYTHNMTECMRHDEGVVRHVYASLCVYAHCWRAGVSRWPERTRARVRVGYRQIAPHRVAAVRQDNLSARRYGRMCGGSLHGYCVCVCVRARVCACVCVRVPSFWQ